MHENSWRFNCLNFWNQRFILSYTPGFYVANRMLAMLHCKTVLLKFWAGMDKTISVQNIY